MEAKELRIDNWIKYNFKMQGWKYVQVCANDFHNGFRDDKFVSINYKPIPLTEEWILKFGFDKDSDNDYCFKGFHLEDRNIDTFLPVEKILKLKDNFGCWYVGAYLRELKYVHQLQNLYFALTNEELIIKQ
jgi:hypothetical protein